PPRRARRIELERAASGNRLPPAPEPGVSKKTVCKVENAGVLSTMNIDFEWNKNKESRNIEKHGVSFHEAATVFGDPLSWTFPDPYHSIGEHRFLTIGLSAQGKVLVVSHTDRGSRTRIISTRKATKQERRDYEQG
ncbi:MAG: BrnT family toxin, partial [Victivallales bacterium]|nr:BrnT family toxin [Victivallales bacterium]